MMTAITAFPVILTVILAGGWATPARSLPPECRAVSERPAPAYPGTVKIGVPAVAFVLSEATGHVFALAPAFRPRSGAPVACPATVSMLAARTGRPLRTVALAQNPGITAVDDRARRLFVVDTAGQHEGQVTTLNTTTGTVIADAAPRPCPCGIAVSARVGRVFVTYAGGIRVLDATRGRVLQTMKQGGGALQPGTLAQPVPTSPAYPCPGAPGISSSGASFPRTLHLGRPLGDMVVSQATGHVFIVIQSAYEDQLHGCPTQLLMLD